MKMHSFAVAVLVSVAPIALIGCAAQATPRLTNGGYYMSGDASCALVKPLTSTRILCADKHKNVTGYRDVMTAEQLQMYQFRQLKGQARHSQARAQLRQMSQTAQQTRQRSMQQGQSYGVPVVQPTWPTSVSNGTTYASVGNTLIGSDGTTCQIVGDSTICN